MVPLFLLFLLLVLPTLPPPTSAAAAATPPPIRFWIDEYGYARGETTILRELLAAGSVAGSAAASPLPLTLAGESRSAAPLSPRGFWAPEAWDVYIAPRSACARAWAGLTPGKVVTCVPGLGAALASKPALAAALGAAYGDGDGWRRGGGGGGGGGRGGGVGGNNNNSTIPLWPRAYPLPARLWDWLAVGSKHPTDLWAVKSRAHRGAGVTVAPFREAAAAAAAGAGWWRWVAAQAEGSPPPPPPPPPAVAQDFIAPQAIAAGGRRFYLRVWAVVAGGGSVVAASGGGGGGGGGGGAGGGGTTLHPAPRLYLAPGGIAIFGPPPTGSDSSAPSPSAPSSIVNMWLIKPDDAVVWGWAEVLKAAGGGGAGAAAFSARVRAALAAALVSASPALASAADAAGLPIPGGSALELVGADFVVRVVAAEDGEGGGGEGGRREAWVPTLVEVNALPSLARLGKAGGRRWWARLLLPAAPAAEAAFDGAKERLVGAYTRLLAGAASPAASPPPVSSPACAAAAAGLSPAAAAALPGLLSEAALATASGFTPLTSEVVAARAAAAAWAAQAPAASSRLRGRLLGGRFGAALAALLSPWPSALVAAGRLACVTGLAGGPLPPPPALREEVVALEAALAACVR